MKPAFLWDPARRRIVWANAAALQWFGARSLSELVERPFDAREAGVRTLAQLARTTEENNAMRARLAFPSTGRETPIAAVVRPYPLGNGRPGLLVIGEKTDAQRAPVLAEILNEMPQPVLALTPAGEPVYVNAAARELLGRQAADDVRELFSTSLALRTFLLRALEAGTAVEVRDTDTRLGRRTLRLTARASQQGDLIVITIDDLTDRLQAERLETAPVDLSALMEETTANAPVEEEEAPSAGLAPEELAALRRMMEAMEAETAATDPAASDAPVAESAEPEVTKSDSRLVESTASGAEGVGPAETGAEEAPFAEGGDESGGESTASQTPLAAPETEGETGAETAEATVGKPEAGEASEQPRARITIRRRPAGGMTAQPAEQSSEKGDETAPARPADETAAPVQANEEPERAEDVAESMAEESTAEPKNGAASATAKTMNVPEARQPDMAAEAATSPKADTETAEADSGESDEEERERPEPPALVREVLDHRPEPIILHRSEAFYFANRAAVERFGHPLRDRAWDELAQRLSAGKEGEEIALPDASGREHLFRLKRDVFPWRAGVVVQSTLEPLEVDDAHRSDTGADARDGGAEAALAQSAAAAETKRSGSVPGQAGSAAEKRMPAPVIRIQTERPKPDLTMVGGAGAAQKVLPAREAPWDTIRENAVDGLLVLDETGHILELNDGARRLLQVTETEAKGQPLRAFMHEESATALDVWLASLQQDADGKAGRREMLLKTARGDVVPVRLLLGRVRGAGAQKAAYCAALCDISEWKKREEDLLRAREKAEAESARKSTFLASISHELRTPLNAILGFAEVLRQELYGPLGNDKYRDYARDIHESGKHLLALVNDLLDMARVESGRLQVEFTEVDLTEVVEAAVTLLRDRIAASGIDLVRVTPDDLPKVVADRRSMKQILLNLLSNAITYGREGGKVVVALKARENGGLELSVKDTGPGMTREELEAALQPYRRVPRTGGEDSRGTGLGLPLAKALTQANKATFEIESAPGKGTEVRITFPPHRVLS